MISSCTHCSGAQLAPFCATENCFNFFTCCSRAQNYCTLANFFEIAVYATVPPITHAIPHPPLSLSPSHPPPSLSSSLSPSHSPSVTPFSCFRPTLTPFLPLPSLPHSLPPSPPPPSLSSSLPPSFPSLFPSPRLSMASGDEILER